MTVYFAQQSGGERMIKIGYTGDLNPRIGALRSASSTPLEVVASMDGGRETEQFVHAMLDTSRHHGEWFRPTAEVLKFIESVKDASYKAQPSLQQARKDQYKYDAAKEDLRVASELLGIAAGPIYGGKTMGAALEMLLPRLQNINPAWSLRRLRSLQSMSAANVNLWIVRDLVTAIEQQRAEALSGKPPRHFRKPLVLQKRVETDDE